MSRFLEYRESCLGGRWLPCDLYYKVPTLTYFMDTQSGCPEQPQSQRTLFHQIIFFYLLVIFGPKCNTVNHIQSKQKTNQLINFVGIICTTQSGNVKVYLNLFDFQDNSQMFTDLETKYAFAFTSCHRSLQFSYLGFTLFKSDMLKMRSSNQIQLKTKQPYRKNNKRIILNALPGYTQDQQIFT